MMSFGTWFLIAEHEQIEFQSSEGWGFPSPRRSAILTTGNDTESDDRISLMPEQYGAGVSKARRKPLLLLAAMASVYASCCAAAGATNDDVAYPARAVRIVVPFPAGGTTDTLPRVVANRLTEKWKQPVIVENRSGAGGNIGAAAVASSDADGYTLLASPPGPITINEFLYKTLPFKPSDLTAIAMLGTTPNVIAVRPNFPAKTVQELIAYVKSHPEKVTFASQGNGSTSHLAAIRFEDLAGVRMIHVPYRGSAPALQDLMGDTVDLFFGSLTSLQGLYRGGQVRILAVCSPDRLEALPDIPTVREAGVREFVSETWYALMAPTNTPETIRDKLNSEITKILDEPDIRAQFVKLGIQPRPMSMTDMARFIEQERLGWKALIDSEKITVE
jgi:tripartite-type tricarboxylate transporter receptor subunit TctC